MKLIPLALLVLALTAVGAINVFAVHFGAEMATSPGALDEAGSDEQPSNTAGPAKK